MLEGLLAQHVWLWPVLWQSTAVLTLGLLGSYALRKRAVRAHQLLLLALVGAIAAPVLSHVVKQHEWGMLESKPAPAAPVESHPPAPRIRSTPIPVESAPTPKIDRASTPVATPPAPPAPESARTIEWARLVLPAWGMLSALLVIRLVVRFLLGCRLVRRSEPCATDEITGAIANARARFGIRADIRLGKSPATRSPVIWCWGLRPTLLVPEKTGEDNAIDWASIVCHELAHWKRRDHLSSLWAELVLCALPFSPSAWLAQRRLKHLSEQACDDWVIAAGQVGTRYARTLLGLSAQPQGTLALSVVTSKRTLAGRIRRIVEDRCSSPHSGRPWSLAVAGAAACLAVTIAFAQTRPEAVTQPSWAATGIAPTDVKLSREVERIIRANTRTLSKLKSAQATIEIERRNVVNDKGALAWRQRCSEWFDGNKARIDTHVTPDPNGPRQILVHSTETGDSYSTVPSDNRRVIVTQGHRIITTQVQRDSDHDRHMAWIVEGEDPNVSGRGDSPMLLRHVRFGEWIDTLEQQTRFLAARGDLPTISETQLNGDPALLLEWDIENTGDGWVYKIWVLPKKGHSIAKFQFLIHDRLIREHTMEIADYGNGVFWYRRAEARNWFYDGNPGNKTIATVAEFHPNVPVDPTRFTLARLGIPTGTMIQDNVAGMNYVYRVAAESGNPYLELYTWQWTPPPRAEDRYKKTDHLDDLGISLLEAALIDPNVGEMAGIQRDSLLDPNQISLRLVDDDRLPVAGAKASRSVSFREDMLGGILEWIGEQTSDQDGYVRFEAKDVLPAQRKTTGLYILHEERGLGAVWELSPADAGKSFTVRLAPVCRVRGNVVSPDLESVNMPLGWAYAYVYWGDNAILAAAPRNKPHLFDLSLPPGEYTLEFGGAGSHNHVPTRITASLGDKRQAIRVSEEQRELDLGSVELEPTGVAKLIGKAAPELGPIKNWRNGDPITLAHLQGQVVLLHFGKQSPSVSGDLPRLVKLHEAFGDKGLTIIAIYNCDSMADLEQRWTEAYERHGGAADVPFRVAIDSGESTFYEGTDRERPGATYGRYDLAWRDVNILIDPAGNVLGNLHLRAGEETIRKLLDILPEPAETPPTPAWRTGFDEIYRLEEGEIVRHIASPFIPQRRDYYIDEASRPKSRRPESPCQFCFNWDGALELHWKSFDECNHRLGCLMHVVLGLADYECEDPDGLFDIEISGDWIVRSDATRKAKLRAMEAILARDLGRTIRFERRPAENAVVIARGRFKFHALFDDENVRLFAGESQPARGEHAEGHYDGADSVGEFLEKLGPMLGVTMIDRTDREHETNIPFEVHLGKPLVRTIRDMAEKRRRLEALLANLTAQTELKFEIRTEPAEIWMVVEDPK